MKVVHLVVEIFDRLQGFDRPVENRRSASLSLVATRLVMRGSSSLARSKAIDPERLCHAAHAREEDCRSTEYSGDDDEPIDPVTGVNRSLSGRKHPVASASSPAVRGVETKPTFDPSASQTLTVQLAVGSTPSGRPTKGGLTRHAAQPA